MNTAAIPDIVTDGYKLDEGDTVQIDILTKNAAGTLADPSTLVVQVQPVGGSVTTYTYGSSAQLTKTTTGTYVLKHPIVGGMDLHVRTITTGDAGAEPGYIPVRPSNISA